MPADPIQQAIASIGPVSEEARLASREQWERLSSPEGGLGRLRELGEQLAAIRRTERPSFHERALAVFAADHGVVEEGVSSHPKGATAAMVENLLEGGAAVCVFARSARADLHVVDVGVDMPARPARPGFFSRKVARGTRNIARERAMTSSQARQAVEVGLDVGHTLCTAGAEIIGIGDLGAGNTTSASAVLAALTGLPVSRVVGPGSGEGEDLLPRKSLVVSSALERHSPDRDDPWDVLQSVGGLEIAAMAGAFLACASRRVPTIVDGLTSTTAALWATRLAPALQPYLIPSHLSSEPGHRIALEELHLRPFLDFSMRLGAGTGAALQMGLCELTGRLLRETGERESWPEPIDDEDLPSLPPLDPRRMSKTTPPSPSP